MDKLKKISLIVLALTSLALSRLMFVFFNDPEGPNLLIVVVTAVMVYGLSLAVYLFNTKVTSLKKFLLALFVQILTVALLHFFLS